MLSKLWKTKLKSVENPEAVKNPLAILILPFVSLIGEKELRLKKLLREMKIDTEAGANHMKLSSIYGHRRSQTTDETNVVLCTIEKASQLLNHLLSCDSIDRL